MKFFYKSGCNPRSIGWGREQYNVEHPNWRNVLQQERGVTDGGKTRSGDHFWTYPSTASLRCVPESNNVTGQLDLNENE